MRGSIVVPQYVPTSGEPEKPPFLKYIKFDAAVDTLFNLDI